MHTSSVPVRKRHLPVAKNKGNNTGQIKSYVSGEMRGRLSVQSFKANLVCLETMGEFTPASFSPI